MCMSQLAQVSAGGASVLLPWESCVALQGAELRPTALTAAVSVQGAESVLLLLRLTEQWWSWILAGKYFLITEASTQQKSSNKRKKEKKWVDGITICLQLLQVRKLHHNYCNCCISERLDAKILSTSRSTWVELLIIWLSGGVCW